MSFKVDGKIEVAEDTGCEKHVLCQDCPYPDCIKHRETLANATRILLGQGLDFKHIAQYFGITKRYIKYTLATEL